MQSVSDLYLELSEEEYLERKERREQMQLQADMDRCYID